MHTRTVGLITFGLGGHSEQHVPEKNSSSHLSGYAKPDTWKPNKDTIYPDGTPVFDHRELFEKSPMLAIKAPMVSLGLKPGEVDSLDVGTIQDSIMCKAMMEESGSQFGSLLGYHAAQKVTAPKEYGSLDNIALDLYIKYWKERGSRYGEIKDNEIIWE